jgi:hypothetical protein
MIEKPVQSSKADEDGSEEARSRARSRYVLLRAGVDFQPLKTEKS